MSSFRIRRAEPTAADAVTAIVRTRDPERNGLLRLNGETRIEPA